MTGSLSLLHIGYREMSDSERLESARHSFNLEFAEKRLTQSEFVVASPLQQQVINSFTATPTGQHLVLRGPAGTGKTLVALQVANNIMETNKVTAEGEGRDQTVLVVTTQHREKDVPIMRYLDERTPGAGIKLFEKYQDLKKEFVPSEFIGENDLLHLCEGLAQRFKGQQIIMLIDEIGTEGFLRSLSDIQIPQSVRLILIVNPVLSLLLSLPTSFVQVTLTTAFRSTIAITSLAQFISKQEKNKKRNRRRPLQHNRRRLWK